MTATNTVKSSDLRKNLSDILLQVRGGQEILVTSRGQVVARLMPPAAQRRRPVGLLQGKIHLGDDFDETPADIISSMYGENE